MIYDATEHAPSQCYFCQQKEKNEGERCFQKCPRFSFLLFFAHALIS